MYGIIFAYKNINEYKRKKLFFKSENIDGKKKFVNGIKGKGVRFYFPPERKNNNREKYCGKLI